MAFTLWAQRDEMRTARLKRFASAQPARGLSDDRGQQAKREAVPTAPSTRTPHPPPPLTERTRRLQRLEKFVVTATEATAEADDDEEAQLKAALAFSLQPVNAPSPKQPPASGANDLWAPPRYVPAASGSDKTLRLVERVQVRDGGYCWQPASAFLDTGNQHMTIVDTSFAKRHALYSPGASIFATAERWTTLHGVVPGATSRVPVVTIALEIRGQTYTIPAAVSEMQGHDLLLGIDVLRQLFAAGFTISVGSV